ncbi:hypothetical protein [Ralstonia solanacearum]|uniref:hypothetical protein n=1 Tax=Ralstonia solanacearum TaxID=305 RepID=UPI0001D9522A|nr:hypothetical protein [Ralstonia solanacearum]CBJ43102.1 exported protein of unknown function [Ralstonia solanacearum CFBP2957]
MRNINTVALLVCAAGGLYAYKYYLPDGAKIEIAIPTINQKALPTQPKPESPKPAPIITAQPQHIPPQETPKPPAQQSGSIDPWTAELARQADARIARQNQEANAQNNAIRTSNMNAGRCAQLVHDRQMLTWQLSQTGWELEQRSVRAQLQIVQSEMVRFGC